MYKLVIVVLLISSPVSPPLEFKSNTSPVVDKIKVDAGVFASIY